MSSRIHHTELSRRDQWGIRVGWVSLAILIAGLIGLAGAGIAPLWVKIVLGAGVAASIAYLVMRKDAAVAAIVSPSTGRHANSTVFILGVLVVLGLVNYIASRHYVQRDMTKQQLNVLSPQTKEVLKGLKSKVDITAYYSNRGRGGADAERIRTMLTRYREVAKANVSVQFIDPIADPMKAMQSGISQVPTIVIETEGRKEFLTSATIGEQEMTSAIVKVARPTAKKVYFLYGHGETDIESMAGSEKSMGILKEQLTKGLKYDVARLELSKAGSVPGDATVVVIAGPTGVIPPHEEKSLTDYLGAGGKILLLVNAGSPVPAGLAAPWGVEIADATFTDPDPRIPQGVAVVRSFESHQIAKEVQGVGLPLARPVSPASPAPAGVTATSLGKASDKSGEKSIAVVVSKEISGGSSSGSTDANKKSARMVVIGSSLFASDAYLSWANNYQFALNTVNWLAEEEALISIPPKQPDYETVNLMPGQARWIFLLTVIVVPLGVVATGVTIWWRRR